LPDVAAALSYAECKIVELRKESPYNDPALMMIAKDEARRWFCPYRSFLDANHPRRGKAHRGQHRQAAGAARGSPPMSEA
jgi:hypothetical protein